MKVYFSSSLRAKKLYKKNFQETYKIIKDLGYKHTSEFVLKADSESYYSRTGKDFASFYKNLISQIKKADICVFEVSLHSLGIGYCVNLALDMGKPVIALHLKGKEPIFFKGIKDERFQLYEYIPCDLKSVLEAALDIAKGSVDIRFTFFITSRINNFLSWVSKTKKTPRAVYLRNLLEAEIEKEGFTE